MKIEYQFTVFTPTFNRANTLHRVYESLKRQTYRDFEWVIVDDGSADDTKELVESWMSENIIPIRYFYQHNQGKHIAFNNGVKQARGELFLPLDSDDECVPTALERFKYHWDQIDVTEKNKFSAVTSLCMNQHNILVGDKFPKDVLDSDSVETKYKFKVKGEKWGFHRTEVLKEFPFPDMEGTKFVPEGIIWSQISKKYKTRYINEMLRIYWVELDENRLTNTPNPAKFAKGQALWHQSILNNEINWFRYAPKEFLRSAVHYIRFSLHDNVSFLGQLIRINNRAAQLLVLMMYPVGRYIYSSDKNRLAPE